MAARKTSPQGAKPDKLFRDALMVAVNREVDIGGGKRTKRLQLIAERTAELAASGDMQAIKEVADRLDGKPAQSIGVGQDESLGALTIKWQG